MNIRLVMIALLAIVCNTSKADDLSDTDPLYPWWDGSSSIILRTIDSEHTVLDAMTALQTINSSYYWSDYSSYTFYLAEDVNLSELGENWTPLGTSSDNPFQSSFYCYKPTYGWFKGPDTQESEMGYPKYDAERKEWEGALKYTFNVNDILNSFGKTKYIFSVSYIESYISEHSEELSYSDIDGFISTELESNSILYKRTEDDNLIVITDNLNSPLSDITYSEEGSLDSYSDINEFISQILPSYFAEYDESTLSVTMLESDMENATILSSLKPTATEQANYKPLPVPNGNIGYYKDESSNTVYYTTDGHVGTCKISYMTINDSYEAAGFFGYVASGISLSGFTFENCSVTNTNETVADESTDNYTGILYGKCKEGYPNVYDIYIGSESNPCTITAKYAGGIYGYNDDSSNCVSSTSASGCESFDAELADDAIDNEMFINKIYVRYVECETANKISCYIGKAKNTVVYAEGLTTKEAFASGTGQEGDPFLVSSPDHIKAMVELYKNPSLYTTYTDLAELYSNEDDFISKFINETSPNLNFKQTQDIDFGEEPLIGGIGYYDSNSGTYNYFMGTYDGDGRTITVDVKPSEDASSGSYIALFAYTNSATIKNLSIKGDNTNETNIIAGGIIGYEYSSVTLDNCIINVNVGESGCGLIGNLESSSSTQYITDCYNKAANHLPFYPDARTYSSETSFFSWVDGDCYGTGTKDFPLQIKTLEQLAHWADYGLYYELIDNIIVQDCKLFDPDGNSLLPNDATNEDCYIENFYGSISSPKDEYEVIIPGKQHIIAGLTNKALFGTITGNSEISHIGFVNCYNKDGDHSVKLASSIADDATLEVDKCYSDGYFDLLDGTTNVTVTDSYAYSEIPGHPVITPILDSGEVDYYSFDKDNPRYVLSENCIIIKDENDSDVYTDAIATQPSSNEIISTDDPRLQFKYNVAYNGKVRYMKLIDTMDYYEAISPSEKDSYAKFEKGVYATAFKEVPSATVEHVYYRRKANNDWESVCLPFAYSLSNISNSSNFTAYTFSSNNDTNEATFAPFTHSIEAGEPVLFFNSGKSEGVDFVVKVSNPDGVEMTKTAQNDDTFYGSLQITGLENTYNDSGDIVVDVNEFDESCYSKTTTEEDETITEYNMYVYKISGAGTQDNGTLLKCDENSWIYPFRTYVKLIPAAGTGAKSIRFFISDDATTSINTTETTPIAVTGNVYSLDGRKVSAKGLNGLKSGLYIMNGKKYVVK